MVALSDPDLDRAAARRQEYAPGARIYPSLDTMLASEAVDLVDIITPPPTHAALCLAAARANVHFLCQKPLSDTLDQARSLVSALARYPKVCGVHENHRYRPWFQTVLARQTAGALGAVRSVRLAQHDPGAPPEPFKRDAPLGVLLEYGVHLVDMACALLGDPIRVSARTHQVNPGVHGESLAAVTIHFAEATATIDLSWKAFGLQQGEALVIGDAGEAWYEGRMTRGESARFRIAERGAVTLDETRVPTAEYGEAFYALEREFIDCILSGAPFTQAFATNLRALSATFAGYDAARDGVTVAVRS